MAKTPQEVAALLHKAIPAFVAKAHKVYVAMQWKWYESEGQVTPSEDRLAVHCSRLISDVLISLQNHPAWTGEAISAGGILATIRKDQSGDEWSGSLRLIPVEEHVS